MGRVSYNIHYSADEVGGMKKFKKRIRFKIYGLPRLIRRYKILLKSPIFHRLSHRIYLTVSTTLLLFTYLNFQLSSYIITPTLISQRFYESSKIFISLFTFSNLLYSI